MVPNDTRVTLSSRESGGTRQGNVGASRPVEVVALDAQKGAVAAAHSSQRTDDLSPLRTEGATEDPLSRCPLGAWLSSESLALRRWKEEKHLFRHRHIVAGGHKRGVTVVTMG